jgi:hypothetical protein
MEEVSQRKHNGVFPLRFNADTKAARRRFVAVRRKNFFEQDRAPHRHTPTRMYGS